MKARLKVESLDGRIVPSTVAYDDINRDGWMDNAAITGARTITVSLGNSDGGHTVAATLTAPNGGSSLQSVGIRDVDADGDLDVVASGFSSTWAYTHTWLGNGDGTFDSPTTSRWKFPRNFV